MTLQRGERVRPMRGHKQAGARLKSAAMARRWSAILDDLDVPESIVEELERATDEAACSVAISVRLLSELRQAAQGLHVIAVGWESRLPTILELAGVVTERK